MSLETEKFYNNKYCERINAKRWRFNLTPKTMLVLHDYFKPKSVIDVGCANGLHLKAFKELGVERLFGIEGTSAWAPYIEKYFGDQYIIADLRKPLPSIGSKFDLVISFEVLEHLEKEFAKQAVQNICSLGDTLVITANPTHGGFYHLNPKPKKYWIKLFEDEGFEFCEDDVEQLQSVYQKGRCSQWFKTGLMVFKR